ncbi:MAG: hypothetical protein LBS03_03600 [Bacteroidales bacterium]|jgi:hypothetical protein|nr:hypothetical protein [Bacteroidales bacterium]
MKRWLTYLFFFFITAMPVITGTSCGSSKKTYGYSKKSASMKKINRESPLIYDKEGGYRVDHRGPEQKKADAAKAKKESDKQKESDKTYKEALERHRSIQSEEVRQRMDYHLSVSDKEHSKEKEFFLKRWFRPSTDKEKIEKRRAKEVKKRMAATRKKAEQNNAERMSSSFKGHKRKSKGRADPADYQHGGGGVYREGKGGGVNAADYEQSGGGGNYKEGKAKSVKAESQSSGGGGRYKAGKANSVKAESQSSGGGGRYKAGKAKSEKAESQSSGGGGRYKEGRSKGVNPSDY